MIGTLEQLAIAKRLMLIMRELPESGIVALNWPDREITVEFIAVDLVALTRKGKKIECTEDEARDILEAFLC